jgi:predicted dehydrogenase
MAGRAMSLRCAVVGVGHLGRFHAQKYKLIPEATLVGVCDIAADRARSVAAELDVAHFEHAGDLVGKVDAVTVAASTAAHFALCRLFLENGIHVLVEKPITTTSEEAEEICGIAERSGARLQVGHVERFNPALRAVRGKLKEPKFIECHRLAPFTARSVDVDVVLDLMIHDLDVILSLIHSRPASVAAVGTPVLTKKLDIANARIEFESGAVANVTASRVSLFAQRKFRVFQQDQYLSIDFQSGEVNLLTKTGEWSEGNIPIERETHTVGKGDALLDETRDFVLGIVEQRSDPTGVSGRDGLEALRLAEDIVRDATGRLA